MRVCVKNGFSKPRGVISNNCYAYSIGLLRQDGTPFKLQPGDLSTGEPFELDTCHEVVKRTEEDLKVLGGRAIKFSQGCKKNENKIVLILAPGLDYHFLVHHQDVKFLITCDGETRKSIAEKFKVNERCVKKQKSYKKGTSVYVKNADCFSHKRGIAFPPSLMDSNGKIIKDPRTATFDYGDLNYTVFCTAFCVKQRDDMTAPIIKSSPNGDLNVQKYDRRYTGMKKIIQTIKKVMKIK